jgi:hypothetical protein
MQAKLVPVNVQDPFLKLFGRFHEALQGADAVRILIQTEAVPVVLAGSCDLFDRIVMVPVLLYARTADGSTAPLLDRGKAAHVECLSRAPDFV